MESRYKGPYPVISTSETGVTVMKNHTPKKYHFQNIKPYFSKINALTIFIIASLFFFCIVSTTEVMTPLNSKSGMIFQHAGDVFNKVDEWNIVTTFDTNILWSKLYLMKKIELQVENYLAALNNLSMQEKTNYRNIFSHDNEELEERLLNLEDSADSTPKRSRGKRALIRFGSSIMKFLCGTPDADDADDYNKKFSEIFKNQHKQEELKESNF